MCKSDGRNVNVTKEAKRKKKTKEGTRRQIGPDNIVMFYLTEAATGH